MFVGWSKVINVDVCRLVCQVINVGVHLFVGWYVCQEVPPDRPCSRCPETLPARKTSVSQVRFNLIQLFIFPRIKHSDI